MSDLERLIELQAEAGRLASDGQELPAELASDLAGLTQKTGLAEEIDLGEDGAVPDEDLPTVVAGALVILAERAAAGDRKAAEAIERIKAAASDPDKLRALLGGDDAADAGE
ncbi:MAG TPA: hypothetical protein VFW33_14180 [Gemmataceae bacterium]|nr:hypothetical protein [Gemmataceae bacterium]